MKMRGGGADDGAGGQSKRRRAPGGAAGNGPFDPVQPPEDRGGLRDPACGVGLEQRREEGVPGARDVARVEGGGPARRAGAMPRERAAEHRAEGIPVRRRRRGRGGVELLRRGVGGRAEELRAAFAVEGDGIRRRRSDE